MRAMCGAIIAAGAMIGLGLTAIGLGTRYQSYPYLNGDGQAQFVLFKHLDTTLMAICIIGGTTLVIGLGIAFAGLAYHHHRRHLEHQHLTRHNGSPRQPAGSTS